MYSVVSALKNADLVMLSDKYPMFDYHVLPDGQHVLSFSNSSGDSLLSVFKESTTFRLRDNIIDYEDDEGDNIVLHLYKKANVL